MVGGGGFRTPHVWEALLRDRSDRRVDHVVLHDSDEHRLRVIEAVCRRLAVGHPDPPRLEATTSLERAVEGSDFVFAAMRVGGLEGRCADEHVALDEGVLGQETTGPGGIAYAIRTVPVMMRLAETMRASAPGAYLLNFTNPAGIITEATSRVLGDRVLGICDTPSELGRRVAAALGLSVRGVGLDYVGLNHLGWMRRVLVDGQDVLPALMADERLLGTLEEAHVFGTPWLRTLGLLPNEYLYYYYANREAVAAIRAARATRGDFLLQTQSAFYEQALGAGDDIAELWRRVGAHRGASYMAEAKGHEQGELEADTAQSRASNPDAGPAREGADGEDTAPGPATGVEGGQGAQGGEDSLDELDVADQGYAGVALRVMAAISRGEPSTLILNVRNRGTVEALPGDAVVEVPTLVDAAGLHPLTLPSQPTLHQSGLMQQVKAVERHAIAAGLTGDPQEALLAFALHPLVGSVETARRLVDGYARAIPQFAQVIGRGRHA